MDSKGDRDFPSLIQHVCASLLCASWCLSGWDTAVNMAHGDSCPIGFLKVLKVADEMVNGS